MSLWLIDLITIFVSEPSCENYHEVNYGPDTQGAQGAKHQDASSDFANHEPVDS
jgi:hypothetical protein